MAEIRFTPYRFTYDRTSIDNTREAIERGLSSFADFSFGGSTIALAVGSRGIACIANVVQNTILALQDRGASPFIIPAMGSHGGATAEGQRHVLESYGITEHEMGVPIRCSMETVELSSDGLKNRLYADRIAWTEADFIVPINRVKAHTDFVGPHESGLLKMLVIGLGKHDQAKAIHAFGLHGLRELITPSAKRVLESGRVLFGIGIVENAYEEPAIIEVVPAADMERRDAELLVISKRLSPGLPVEDVDLLIVDELGKDKSGTGLDTNVIGRRYLPGEPEPESPRIDMIYVRRLSGASHGNALGMGLADIVHREFADAVDYPATYENIVTSSFLERGKLPIVAESDGRALDIALRALHTNDLASLRALHLRSTLELETIGVTDAFVPILAAHPIASPSGDAYIIG